MSEIKYKETYEIIDEMIEAIEEKYGSFLYEDTRMLIEQGFGTWDDKEIRYKAKNEFDIEVTDK